MILVPENANAPFPPAGYIHGHQEQHLPALLPPPGISQSGRIQKPKRRRSNSVSLSVVDALSGEQKNGLSILPKTQDHLGSSKTNGALAPLSASPPTSGSIQTGPGTFPPTPHNLGSSQPSPTANSSRGPSNDSPTATTPLLGPSPEAKASPNQTSSNSDQQEQKSRQQIGTEVCGGVGTSMEEELRRYEHSGLGERVGSLQTDQKRNGRCCGPAPNARSPPIQQPGPPYSAGSPSQQHAPYHSEPGTLQYTSRQYNIDKSQLAIQARDLQQIAYHSGVFPFFPYHQPVFQQPPAATMYTFPPPYSTFQNPLTPQELAFLRSNPHFFAQSVSQSTPTGHFREIAPTPTGSIQMTAHNCSCGSDCDCLGCAAHPYNNRTMNFVRSLRDIVGAEIGQNGSRGHIQAHYGGQPPTALAPMRNSGCCGNKNISTQLQESSRSCVGLYDTIADLPPQAITWPPLPSSKESPTTSVAPRSPTNLASQPPWPKVGESDIENDEEESISPSAYFHVDYPIGGCTEEKDGCLCGEGCTCIGCLTHGGHDGVELAGFSADLSGGLMTNGANGRATQESDPTKQFDNGIEGTVPFTYIPSAMGSSGF